MEPERRKLIERVQRNARKDIQVWVRAMELGSATIAEQSASLANELRLSSEIWLADLDSIETLLADPQEISFELIDRVLELLPPHRTLNRFHLERTTPTYEELVYDRGIELADLFLQGENAIDRGDFDIGLNILDAVLKRDQRHFPALIVRGMTLLQNRRERINAIRLLDRAASQPPVVAPERYKQFTLELLAYAFEIDEKYPNAIKSLKRLRNLGELSGSIDYSIARNYALGGQAAEAASPLIDAVTVRPTLLSLALVDDQMARARREIVPLFIKRTEDLGSKTLQLLGQAKGICDIARSYDLHQLDSDISSGFSELKALEEMMSGGCYTVYRDILKRRLPAWTQDFPSRVQSRLGREINRRLDEINLYNEQIEEDGARKRQRILRIGIPVWSSFSITVLVLQLIAGVHPLTALFVALLCLAFGYIPYKAGTIYIQKSIREQQMPNDSLLEVRQDASTIESIRKQILNRLRQDGYLVEHELSKV